MWVLLWWLPQFQDNGVEDVGSTPYRALRRARARATAVLWLRRMRG